MWKRLYGFTLLLFVAVCIGKAPAQVTSAGSIAGQVVDSTGALVPTATVVAIQAQTNAHAIPRYRVNGTVSNMPEFKQAFACKEGLPMVRGGNACRTW